ncbi:YktB family protein [Salipaludibacillus aurantiacus]|uniref:UPF0637 protein SAMN05518684_12240 n=1 Tax=Salipaludibacillus aurantiacus TaxID=1601833 RepID=A0A1H9X0T1_9BACI|nr:DUF1054 domain-containing protein [Salipaludibacillus aurantiacus]SES39517.1 Uncharacterized protein YktB, UPF0637 family [Salipaludibacillus aurantiacus]
MSFKGFTSQDFDVFAVEGLDERMEAIKQHVRPKLEELGRHFSSVLTEKTNEEMFFHVAKHARRKVNPPDDTWVAFANNKRGYKKLPHFQIGLFGSHVFIWFAVIYESPVKEELGHALKEQISTIEKQIPDTFYWSVDHTKPEAMQHNSISKEQLNDMFERLSTVKKAELLCGVQLKPEDDQVQDGQAFLKKAEKVFDTLLPLYETSMRIYVQHA